MPHMRIWGRELDKKILIGSILVLVILLLMPSIPAIQQKTIEEKEYSNFVEEWKDVNLEDIKVLDEIKHPLLYEIVVFILCFRNERALKLWKISIEDYGNDFRVKRPLLFIRSVWLLLTISEIAFFWNNISDIFGWNWGDLIDILILHKPNW